MENALVRLHLNDKRSKIIKLVNKRVRIVVREVLLPERSFNDCVSINPDNLL